MLLTDSILGNVGPARPPRDQRLLCFVMDRLAMAVGSGLPIAPTLRALAQEPDLTGAGIRRAAWRQRLGLMLGDIEAGRSLSETFERHLRAYLPGHFVSALRCAEKADNVRRVLPLLAANLVAAAKAKHRFQGALAYPLMLFAVMASIVSGLFVFIVPKFLKMFDEMAPGQHSPFTGFLQAISYIIVHVGPPLLLAVAVLVCLNLLRCVLGRKATGRRLLEAVGEHLPLAQGFLRRRGLAELAGALAAFLAAGADVSVAARWAAESVESRWARRRLQQFASALAAGTACADAWTALGARSPLCDWMVCNAVAREQPADGFQAVAEWALDDLNRQYRRLFMWLEPALVLCNATAIGTVVYCLAGSLFGTVYAILNI